MSMNNHLKLLHFVAALWCICWLLACGPVRAESAAPVPGNHKEPTHDSRAKSELLSPLKLDETYLHNEIPAADSKGTVTLHRAVAEAAAHNKDVQEASLRFLPSDFKFAHLRTAPGVRSSEGHLNASYVFGRR